ncbi:hypothetical protein [Streptomyces sp. NPDC089799]|uniref:hypothetical protein n=1 Tax=Streptomyces sp. NPDC089799 TaxID=3155066 RepID=UPI00342FC9A7
MSVRTARLATAALLTSMLLTACDGAGSGNASAPRTPAKAVLAEADLPEGWSPATSQEQGDSSPVDRPECQVLADLVEAGRPARVGRGAVGARFANAGGVAYETNVFELGEANAAAFLKEVENAVGACGTFTTTGEADGGAEPSLPVHARPLAADPAGDGSYGFSTELVLDSDMSMHTSVVLVRRGGLIAVSDGESADGPPDTKEFRQFTGLVADKLTGRADRSA